jgi:hypothetical protein
MRNKYIDDNSQTNLNFVTLSRKEKLLNMREILFHNLNKQLRQLEIKKKELINNYRQSIEDLDNQIMRGKP